MEQRGSTLVGCGDHLPSSGEFVDPFGVAIDHRGQQVDVGSCAVGDHVHERQDRDGTDDERQQDPERSMAGEGDGAATPPEHGGEEAGDEEEQRHPEPVDRIHQLVDQQVRVRPVVGHQPCPWDEGERGVEGDAEQHGEATERVEVVQPFRRRLISGRRVVHGEHREGSPSRAHQPGN